MPLPNWEIYFSVAFYFGAKIISYTFKSVCCTNYTSYTSTMFRKDPLTSIPERSETEEPLKWVPKKKHEVLKAKYKCLKKLFQIYDASFIGAVPAPSTDILYNTDDTITKRQRRKRSHRTKTDACEDTTEMIHGEIMQEVEYDSASIATENRSLKNKQSCSTQMNSKFEDVSANQNQSQTLNEIINSESNSNSDFSETKCSHESVSEKCTHFPQNNLPQLILPQDILPQRQHAVPYVVRNGRRKLTRFQCFVHRLFGIRQDYILPSEAYAVSERSNVGVKRRGLRVRRLRNVKKIRSESDVNDIKSSAILSYVQSAQKNCLLDTTPRQCPIVGCNMMSYGIINYNDHLNLCHFMDRKYFCHYCHEGFEKEYDKFIHESEHIGLNRLGNNISNLSSARSKLANNSNTQTDDVIPDEKLKKMVSFFDKLTNPDDIISVIANKRSTEINLSKDNDTESQNSSEKRTISCSNSKNIKKCNCVSNSHTTVTSHQYGLPCYHNDLLKGQLSLHGDLERRYRERLPKYLTSEGNLCPRVPALAKQPVVEPRDNRRRRELVYEDGRLNVRSIDSSSKTETAYSTSTPSISNVKLTQGKSGQSISCDSSTDIVLCTSQETVNIPSEESLVRKVRNYKWEPGTKIINV